MILVNWTEGRSAQFIFSLLHPKKRERIIFRFAEWVPAHYLSPRSYSVKTSLSKDRIPEPLRATGLLNCPWNCHLGEEVNCVWFHMTGYLQCCMNARPSNVYISRYSAQTEPIITRLYSKGQKIIPVYFVECVLSHTAVGQRGMREKKILTAYKHLQTLSSRCLRGSSVGYDLIFLILTDMLWEGFKAPGIHNLLMMVM